MKAINRLIVVLVSLITSSIVCAATSYYLIVIDTTRSMVAPRTSTNNSRYQDAITEAKSDLDEAIKESINVNGTLLVAVATFNSGTGYNEVLDFSDGGTAHKVLDNLRSNYPNSATNLADALCTGADELFAESTTDSYKRVMGFYTDLDENDSSGPCAGSNWMQLVIQKFFSVFPNPIFNVTMFQTNDNLTTSGSTLNINEVLKQSDEKSQALSRSYEMAGSLQTLATSQEDEIQFMKALASYTGGQVKGYADEVADPVIDSGDSSGDCGVFFPCD